MASARLQIRHLVQLTRMSAPLKTDVFIAGSGPIGSTLAKYFIDAGYKVVIAEQGSADSFTSIKDINKNEVFVPGSHKKNTIEYQKDIDRFVAVIKSALSPVSIPVSDTFISTLNPVVWGARPDRDSPVTDPQPLLPVSNGKNPNQPAKFNLGAEAVTRGVGGMSTHWTCATPRFHKTLELPALLTDPADNVKEWGRLYALAESLIGTNRHAFDESIRHNLVLRTLRSVYGDIDKETLPDNDWPTDIPGKRVFGPLPLACKRMPNPDYVFWNAADTILKSIYEDPLKREKLTLLTNTGCQYLEIDIPSTGDKKSTRARCFDYLHSATEGDKSSAEIIVEAQYFVIASGAVATPQILFNTDVKCTKKSSPLFPNLGKYITEQPMAFCQIILKKELIDSIQKNPYNLPWWKERVENHVKNYPEDPLRFPFNDPEPQVTTPLTAEKPWHTQIHRDAFSYGAVAATIDTRTIVDFRFFGRMKPEKENTITFETKYTDAFNMPQPTFNVQLGKDDAKNANDMMIDMCDMASKLGGYLPGSEPQFMEPGLALHLGGTVRAGPTKADHVADTSCKVYEFENLYVAGNGVIPTGFAANPTLTSMCYAIRTAEDIIKKLKLIKPSA
ncbi:pyranose 2-oxidase [Schizopora paradoxa]|uniref:Pyranose 2-oxidase n=1 Tax=Schizopora paradoxa TaxID=27342 RepID=A0A0H2R1L3_9AGAM|nr:pyranose 2-oxidase [Schizopora paradoxa]